MSGGAGRAERLLALLQILRRRKRAVTAAELARETGVSPRTLYRDIDALRAQGALIEGEAGTGYLLKPGHFLPPLAFTRAELDALALGAQFVRARGDEELAQAARDALAKIDAILPNDPASFEAPALKAVGAAAPHLAVLRQALRDERKLEIAYRDRRGAATRRIVWPILVGFFDGLEMLAAFCELRGEFRHFRLDRMESVRALPQAPERRRATLEREWRIAEALERDEPL